MFGINFDETNLLSINLSEIDENNVISTMKMIIDNARLKAKETNSTILAIAKSK